MRYQSNRASCGPAALHNALAALGINRSEDELIALCKQTADGTSPAKLIRAIKSISSGAPEAELIGEPFKRKAFADAWVGLWFLVAQRGRPVILCVDAFDHWVACVGALGDRFMVVDSAELGLVFYYDRVGLEKRWAGPNGGYHGIIV